MPSQGPLSASIKTKAPNIYLSQIFRINFSTQMISIQCFYLFPFSRLMHANLCYLKLFEMWNSDLVNDFKLFVFSFKQLDLSVSIHKSSYYRLIRMMLERCQQKFGRKFTVVVWVHRNMDVGKWMVSSMDCNIHVLWTSHNQQHTRIFRREHWSNTL